MRIHMDVFETSQGRVMTAVPPVSEGRAATITPNGPKRCLDPVFS